MLEYSTVSILKIEEVGDVFTFDETVSGLCATQGIVEHAGSSQLFLRGVHRAVRLLAVGYELIAAHLTVT